MIFFSKKLLEWYNPDSRNLPWKQTKDAYKIWLSEIILQQTRVEQGTPYYHAFVKNFPTVQQLAKAPLEDILKLWEGLGYYSRARNLQVAASEIMNLHNGKFPNTYENILKLKGVGSYTAAAISSFAFNLPYAVLDGNVFRVLSRVFGIETPIDSTEGKKQFAHLAQSLLEKKQPALYNQAIMDFGALVCKPQQPLCNQCPFSSTCKALEQNKINLLPVKSKKLIKNNRFLYYFVLFDNENIFIRQRSDKDIWKGLFEFPCYESNQPIENHQQLFLFLKENNIDALHSFNKGAFTYKQTLSHRHIHGFFYEIPLKRLSMVENNWICIPKSAISDYPYPKIIRAYLEDRLLSLS